VVMIEDDDNLGRLNMRSENSQFVALTRHETLSQTMFLMKNKIRVHLFVFSNGPLSDSGDYTVVLQQKFGNNYISLVKKVIL